MIKSVTSIQIDRPMAEVFAFLQDIQNYPAWQVVMTDIKATDGMRQGSVVTYTRSSELGDSLAASVQITKNNGIDALESLMAGVMQTTVQIKLTPSTRNTTDVQITIQGDTKLLPNEAISTAQYVADSRTRADLARLKSVMEATQKAA